MLGLKSANSEMNVTRLSGSTRHLGPPAAAAAHGHQRGARLRGTISEMNVSRIGANEKLQTAMLIMTLNYPPKVTFQFWDYFFADLN